MRLLGVGRALICPLWSLSGGEGLGAHWEKCGGYPEDHPGSFLATPPEAGGGEEGADGRGTETLPGPPVRGRAIKSRGPALEVPGY